MIGRASDPRTASGVDWVLVQPVALTDGAAQDIAHVSTAGEARGMSVSRKTVARLIADAAESRRYDRCCVAVSAAG